MKKVMGFAVLAASLCFAATASAGVIITSSTAAAKKQVTIEYLRSPTGVLQTMTVKQKKLGKWCKKNGGCTYQVYGAGTELTVSRPVVSATENDERPSAVAVPEPGTLMLLGAGLLGMGLVARRRKALLA